jgi:hypothetical protein
VHFELYIQPRSSRISIPALSPQIQYPVITYHDRLQHAIQDHLRSLFHHTAWTHWDEQVEKAWAREETDAGGVV